MSCSPVLSDLQTALATAEAAYHRLVTGQSPRVVVDQNGERIEYTAVSAATLNNYILGLRAQVDKLLGCPLPRMNRPIGFLA